MQGRRIAMIFQDALTALNPVYTVGWQISEMFRIHEGLSRREARERSIDLLGSVGIPSPELRYDNYPHEFSGGMRQRAMIAMAISLDPDVLIADEPTTALDVTVQAQVMELLASLQQRYHMGLVLITHDLGVVAGVADRLVVMYAGTAVERTGGVCPSCHWLKVGNHPDLLVLPSASLPGAHENADDHERIKIDEVRALQEFVHRQSQGLRLVVLDHADSLTVAAANALLKTLEEPRAGVYLWLVTDHPSRLMPTIKSRLQT